MPPRRARSGREQGKTGQDGPIFNSSDARQPASKFECAANFSPAVAYARSPSMLRSLIGQGEKRSGTAGEEGDAQICPVLHSGPSRGMLATQSYSLSSVLVALVAAWSYLVPCQGRHIRASFSPVTHRREWIRGLSSPLDHALLPSSKDWNAFDLSNDLDGDQERVLPDMRYIPRNVQRQSRNYLALRQVGGKDVVHDIYVRDPRSSTFWFVGKVACVSGVTIEDCIARQWNLIETHAVNLRPLDLFPARGVLEMWSAPGDSELDVAYNRPDIAFTKHFRSLDVASPPIKSNLVGFQGEVYERGEEGFRTWRLENGLPARPQVQAPSDDLRAPTDEEMEEIREALSGKDINEIYEEQQRRDGKAT